MSRPAHLPPRCPFQNIGQPTYALGSTSRTSQRDDGFQAQHRRFLSQGTLIEEKPLWLEDILIDSETSPRGIFHRRSVSDSIALLEVSSTSHSPVSIGSKVNATSASSNHKSPEPTEWRGIDCGFETACVYGPNSPRQKSKLTYLESSIVSALLESVSRKPSQYLASDIPAGFKIGDDTPNTSSDHIPEKESRRHSRQRSRVRRIQYISDLERSLDSMETMEAEMAEKVAALFQQRVTLSMENEKLKSQIVGLQQEEMIKDGQYHNLKNEVERLRMIYGRLRESERTSFPSNSTSNSGTSWQILDLGKLSLGGNPVLH